MDKSDIKWLIIIISKVKNYNTVNSDDIYVYVPQGTVCYQPSVDIGK